jgi:hypothetical protein
MHLGCHLAQSSHCSIFIETPLAGKAIPENDLSIASESKKDSTNLKI